MRGYAEWDYAPYVLGPNGVVWETEINVTQGNSFYYFHVTAY